MYYLVLFSGNKPAPLFYLFFQAAHKHFSAQTPSLPANLFTFCGTKRQSARDAKFSFTRNLVNLHNHTAADVLLLIMFLFKEFLEHGKQTEEAGTSLHRVQWHKLLKEQARG